MGGSEYPVGREGGSVRRLHSGSEDGYLWYVVGADGETVYSGIGHVCEDGAREELAQALAGTDTGADIAPREDAESEAQALEAARDYIEDSLGEALTLGEALAVVDWVRGWALDCDWQDADSADIEALALAAPAALLRFANRALDGGLAVALADVRRLALDTVPTAAVLERRALAALARIDSMVSDYRETCASAYSADSREHAARSLDAIRAAVAALPLETRERLPNATAALVGIEAPTAQALAVVGTARVDNMPTARGSLYTAVYRAPLAVGSDRSIHEQAITASSMRQALDIATREAGARGLSVVALAAGNPNGFGASILADGIAAQAPTSADRARCQYCGRLDGMGARVKPRGAAGALACERASCQSAAMREAL